MPIVETRKNLCSKCITDIFVRKDIEQLYVQDDCSRLKIKDAWTFRCN